MEILIFSTVFYPVLGGIENLTLNLSREFVKKGHTVKVITSQKQNEPLPDIEVFYKPNVITMLRLFFWCNIYYMPNISLKGVWPLLFMPRKRWIISHNDFSLTKRKNFLSYLKLFLIRFSSENISVSKSVAQSIKTSSNVIYNCYDDAVFSIKNLASRPSHIIFVGRLVSQKGCDTLIKACHYLKQPYHLTIIGDGPEMPKLKNLAAELQHTENITFAGALNSVEISELLNQHKVLVVPSKRKEGFGIVVLEGLACGCHVIATNAGGLAEAVGSFGKLFQPDNVPQLHKLLEKSLIELNQQNYNQHDLNQYLSNFTKQVVAEKYLSVFENEHQP